MLQARLAVPHGARLPRSLRVVHVWACVCAISLSCAGAGPARNFRRDAPDMHVIAKTRHRPYDSELLPALEARVEEVARECTSRYVANILWAYATMGRRPGELEA